VSLKKPSGNMYPFIDGIWNPVRGKCYHNCKYCYVKRITKKFNIKQRKVSLIDSELRANLGSGNFIFVCSGCDLLAKDVPFEMIKSVIDYTRLFPENKYLIQTKNPERLLYPLLGLSTDLHTICTTIETNHYCPGITKKSPHPVSRAFALRKLASKGFETMVTIEPIINFDTDKLLELIHMTKATQVNIGADSDHKKNKLAEPLPEKIHELISELEKFTKVYQKKNLWRLIK
jgi:DNA repair photolyase